MNSNQIRSELSEVFQQLKAGTIKVEDAEALANVAGKIINSARAQVTYYALRKEAPQIDFLKDDRTPEEKP